MYELQDKEARILVISALLIYYTMAYHTLIIAGLFVKGQSYSINDIANLAGDNYLSYYRITIDPEL